MTDTTTKPIPMGNTRSRWTLPGMASATFPFVTMLVLLLAWHFSIDYFGIPSYIFPRLSSVLHALKIGYIDGTFYKHLLFTLQAASLGYLIGSVLAISLGILLAESKVFERFLYPYIIALQSTPKVALAPLILVWFGYGLASKVVMVALMCFFPLFVNTVTGIRQTDGEMINMMRAFSATRMQVLLRVKLFAAAGHIFAGLQITVVLSLIGAVVSEFIASSRGLGYLVQASLTNFDMAQMIAAIISLMVLGIVGTALLRWLHARIVYWDGASIRTEAH